MEEKQSQESSAQSALHTPSLTPEQEAFTKKWSWGALGLSGVYFFASGLIKEGIYSVIPFLNVYIWVKGLFHGRRMSWEKGEWKNFEVFEKRQRFLDKIGVIFSGIVIILITILTFFVFYFTLPAARSANMFFGDIAAGRVENAYNEATPEFRGAISLEEFEQSIEENDYIKRYAKASFSSLSYSDDFFLGEAGFATLIGKITTENGERYPVEMYFQKIDGIWRVDGFEFK